MDNEMEVQVLGSAALQAMSGAEVEGQVSTAKRYPRSIQAFQKSLEAAVLSSQAAAEDCFYHLERNDSKNNKKVIIEGPSIRFAEVLACYWKNLRIESGVADIGEKYVTTYGACWDLESNVAERFTTKKRITYKDGRRYNEDMAEKAAGAARSIAKREAILKSIPKILWEPIFDKVLIAARGNSIDLPVRRQQMVTYYSKIGVSVEQILAHVNKKTVDELDNEDIFRLKGVATALKEGDTTIDEAFPKAEVAKEAEATASMVDKIKEEAAKANADATKDKVEATPPATESKPEVAAKEPDGPLSKALDKKLKEVEAKK